MAVLSQIWALAALSLQSRIANSASRSGPLPGRSGGQRGGSGAVGLGCVVAATGRLWPREGWRVRSAGAYVFASRVKEDKRQNARDLGRNRSNGTCRWPIHDPRHEMQRVT